MGQKMCEVPVFFVTCTRAPFVGLGEGVGADAELTLVLQSVELSTVVSRDLLRGCE